MDEANKDMKVANVIMEGRFGGPQAWITAVAERLRNDGIETIVVFPKNDSGLFYKKLTEKGIQTRRLGLHCLTKQKSRLVKYFILFFPEIFSLYKLIKKENVDIVHCNNSWQIKGVLAGMLARKPIVWTIHESQTPALINVIFKFLALHFCDAFITAGKRVRAYYFSDQRFAGKQIMEIQAPVDTSVFDPEKVEENRRIALYQGLKIVTVGNINPLKGIEYFVQMAAILNERFDNLNFFVVGSHFATQKEYSEKVFGLAENFGLENFHFYGPSDDVPSVLKAADIYVCSSVAEASPISVWEAISMARPIVSTDVGDVAQFIKDGENGFVVPIKNSAALAEKVALLIEDEELREKFGQKARDVAIKYLDIDICAKKHAEFYRKVLNRE